MNRLGRLFWWLNDSSACPPPPQDSGETSTTSENTEALKKGIEATSAIMRNQRGKAPKSNSKGVPMNAEDGNTCVRVGNVVRFVERFDSIWQFIQTIHSRKNNAVMKDRDASSDNRVKFNGSQSLEEAEKLFTEGWVEGLNQIKSAAKAKVDNQRDAASRSQLVNNNVGFTPNVPYALMGLPNSMVYRMPAVRTTRTLNIRYLITTPGSIPKELIMKAGVALLEAIDTIEKNRIAIKLEYSPFAGWGDTQSAVCLIKLKDYGERTNMLKMCFPLAHPSSLRRLGFKWIETYPSLTDDYFHDGYGRPIMFPDDAKNHCVISDNAIYLTAPQVIGALHCDTNKIIEYINKECSKIESQGS